MKAFRAGLLSLAAAALPLATALANTTCEDFSGDDLLLAPLYRFEVGPLPTEAVGVAASQGNATANLDGDPGFELMSSFPADDLGEWQMSAERYWFPLRVEETRATDNSEGPELWFLAPTERAVPF